MESTFGTTKLIVGLGNPGPRYQNTRHNVGFEVIDQITERLEAKKIVEKHRSIIVFGTIGAHEIILAKPLTYVNASGQAVTELVAQFDISLPQLCVVYDYINLDLGVLRIRRAGSDGGHKGMKSIIYKLNGQEFPRLRVGIGKPDSAPIDYVLGKFAADEREIVEDAIKRAADALQLMVLEGIEVAMNNYNLRARYV